MFSTNNLELVVMAHPLNSSAQKAEASRALWVQGHPDLRCEFLDMQGYIVRPCLTNEKKKKTQTNVSFISLAINLVQPKR